jgi:hypothetical protein
MALQAFFSIKHLALPENYKIDTPVFSITNASSEKNRLMNPAFLTAIGVKSAQGYQQQTIGFATIDGDELDDQQRQAMSKELLLKSGTMKTFLLFLWFIKDNSISLEETYGTFTKVQRWLHYNAHTINSAAEGTFKDILYEEDELKTAVDLLLKYTAICPARPEELDNYDYSDAALASQLRPGFPRDISENKLERAMAFLNTARSTPHIPQKITHYMSILETLFSTEPQEAMQKVSERTAFYLGNDRHTRLALFNDIKKAYDIRSKFVHGGKIKTSYKAMSEYSVKVDKIIRQVLTRIITTDHMYFMIESEASKTYLTELIF